ncbi:MAG: hypothetical protein QM784_38610 [Polyangiaceae bacterium]
MRSWTTPEPPPPRKSRFLSLALVAWLAALALAFRWVWPVGYSPFEDTESAAPEAIDESPRVTRTTVMDAAASNEAISGSLSTAREATEDTNGSAAREDAATSPASSSRAAVPRTVTELPECEAFLGEAKAAGYGRLPTHIGLSPLDAFVGSTQWTKPCLGRRRRTVELCAAIRDGSLVGLTLHAKPVDLTLEECLREAALKLTFRSEPEVRIYRAVLNL